MIWEGGRVSYRVRRGSRGRDSLSQVSDSLFNQVLVAVFSLVAGKWVCNERRELKDWASSTTRDLVPATKKDEEVVYNEEASKTL